MHWSGVLIGLISFIIIGVFHPIVTKGEYYFTEKIWPLFLLLGIVLLAVSTQVGDMIISSAIGVTGFTCLWCIHELKEQTQRVNKGWFPKNPNRDKKTQPNIVSPLGEKV